LLLQKKEPKEKESGKDKRFFAICNYQ